MPAISTSQPDPLFILHKEKQQFVTLSAIESWALSEEKQSFITDNPNEVFVKATPKRVSISH